MTNPPNMSDITLTATVAEATEWLPQLDAEAQYLTCNILAYFVAIYFLSECWDLGTHMRACAACAGTPLPAVRALVRWLALVLAGECLVLIAPHRDGRFIRDARTGDKTRDQIRVIIIGMLVAGAVAGVALDHALQEPWSRKPHTPCPPSASSATSPSPPPPPAAPPPPTASPATSPPPARTRRSRVRSPQ